MFARTAILLAILVWLAPPATAEDIPPLFLDDDPVVLKEGLQVSADGTLWMTRDDAERTLGVTLKRLIPQPLSGKRPQPRREQDSWILCNKTTCATYRGKVAGLSTSPAFDLARLAKTLGFRFKKSARALHLRSPTKPPAGTQARGRLGGKAPDLTLTFLDGSQRRLLGQTGKRVLLVTWAPWSKTREKLRAWRAAWSQRAARDVVLWLAALDVEGAPRVKQYVDAGFDAPVAVDRKAELARAFRLKDVGHWYLIDELGILRAEGTRLDAVALQWIDLHLDEKLFASQAPAPATPKKVELLVLRERVQAEPRDAAPRLALLDALGAAERAEALGVASRLVQLQPTSMPFAFRLAALHMDGGDYAAAVKVLDAARRQSPGTWYMRKQYWALAEPNRFYAGAIDTAWQAAQRKKERAELDHPKRRRR